MALRIGQTVVLALLVCQATAFTSAFSAETFVQPKPPSATEQVQPSVEAEAPLVQMPLTQKQVEGLIAALPEISAELAKIPQDQADNPDPKIAAALDGLARRHGFKDYGEYDDVANNVGFLLDGFDPETKSFVGFEEVIKSKIAAVTADKTLRSGERKTEIKQLNEMFASIETVKFPANITLVAKYYDQLSDLLNDAN